MANIAILTLMQQTHQKRCKNCC